MAGPLAIVGKGLQVAAKAVTQVVRAGVQMMGKMANGLKGAVQGGVKQASSVPSSVGSSPARMLKGNFRDSVKGNLPGHGRGAPAKVLKLVSDKRGGEKSGGIQGKIIDGAKGVLGAGNEALQATNQLTSEMLTKLQEAQQAQR